MNGPVPTLQARLEPVAARRRRLELACRLAAVWGTAALIGVGLIILQRLTGWTSALVLPLVVVVALVAAVVALIRHNRTGSNYDALASQIQARYPDLDGRLQTALQQRPKSGQ